MWKKLSYGLLLFVFILSLSINLIVWDLDFYESENVNLDAVKEIRFFYFGCSLTGYSDIEVMHMGDVRILIWMNVVLCLGLFVFLLFKLRDFLFSGLFSLVLTTVVLCFAYFAFDFIFLWFHKIFFFNDYWLLPQGSKLITLFSLEFFNNAFLQVILYMILLSVFVIALGLKYRRKK